MTCSRGMLRISLSPGQVRDAMGKAPSTRKLVLCRHRLKRGCHSGAASFLQGVSGPSLIEAGCRRSGGRASSPNAPANQKADPRVRGPLASYRSALCGRQEAVSSVSKPRTAFLTGAESSSPKPKSCPSIPITHSASGRRPSARAVSTA